MTHWFREHGECRARYRQIVRENVMELMSLGIVAACFGATWGLLWVIEQLQEKPK